MERRSSSAGANPGSEPRIVRRTRSRSSNGSSPHAANPGLDPLAGVGRCGSRNSVEVGDTFDEEALTEDDEEGEVVPRLRSPAAANSPADVGSQNSNSSLPVGDLLSETPIANSMSKAPADVSRRRSDNCSVPVGDPLSVTPIKTLDGQGSDGGDGMMEAEETFDVEAQDDEEVAEVEVAGDLPVVGDLNHSAPLSRHVSGSDATKQNRTRGPSGNETRWKTFTYSPKSPNDDVRKELESPKVPPTGEEQPDRMMLEGLPDSAEFLAGLRGGPATSSTQVMVEDVEDFEDGQQLNSSENQYLESGNNTVLGAELHPAPEGADHEEGTGEDLQEDSLGGNSEDLENPGGSVELSNVCKCVQGGTPVEGIQITPNQDCLFFPANAVSLRLGGQCDVHLPARRPLEVEVTSGPKSAASQGDEENSASKDDQELIHDQEVGDTSKDYSLHLDDFSDAGVLTRRSKRTLEGLLAPLPREEQPGENFEGDERTPQTKPIRSQSTLPAQASGSGPKLDTKAKNLEEHNVSLEEEEGDDYGDYGGGVDQDGELEEGTDHFEKEPGDENIGAEQSTLPPRAAGSGPKQATKIKSVEEQSIADEEEEVDEANDGTGGVDQADEVMSNHYEETGCQNTAEEMDTPLRSNERRGGRSCIARHPRKRPVWVKDKVEEEGPKLLGVGRSKDNQVVVVMQGLPSDLDSDVEMVRTSLKKGAGKANVSLDEGDQEEEDDEGGDQVAKKKLKLVTVPASKRGAEYTRMFRAPYSRPEEQAVINFFLERGGFSLRKGTRVWREMEGERVCPGRSAQALKQQFLQHIVKRLHDFGVTEKQLEEADNR